MGQNGGVVGHLAGPLMVAVLLATAPGLARAQMSIPEFKELLAEICRDVPNNAKSTKTELAAEAKIKSGIIARRLFEAGGDAIFKQMESMDSGVLQEHRADANKAANECRVKVFYELKDRLDPTKQRSSSGNTPIGTQVTPSHPMTRLTDNKRISVGAFAIGDSLDQVRSSGTKGQMSIAPNGQTLFTTGITTRFETSQDNLLMSGVATFLFENKIVSGIVVNFFERGSCSEQNWVGLVVSETIRDLGEPIQPPTKSNATEVLFGQSYFQDITTYVFSDGIERRTVMVADAVPQGMGMKGVGSSFSFMNKCLLSVVLQREGAGRPLPP